jgi:RNA polymerase sigma-70 factor (ECF subfamily)
MRRSSPVEADDALIALAVEGDRQAFGHLYEKHSLRVLRHAYFLTGDTNLAEDLTAQTFLNALEAMPRYERRGIPFTAWLLRIACNLAINHKKALKNGVHSQLPETIQSEDAESAPEETCAAKVDGQAIWEQVKTLPPDQRQVIVMRFLDDLSYPDIAQLLGKSVGAVRVIQFRALANLRTRVDSAPDFRLKPAVNGNGHTNGNGHKNAATAKPITS